MRLTATPKSFLPMRWRHLRSDFPYRHQIQFTRRENEADWCPTLMKLFQLGRLEQAKTLHILCVIKEWRYEYNLLISTIYKLRRFKGILVIEIVVLMLVTDVVLVVSIISPLFIYSWTYYSLIYRNPSRRHHYCIQKFSAVVHTWLFSCVSSLAVF